MPPEVLPGWFPEEKVLFCGDGTGPYGALIRSRLGERALFPASDDGLPRASAVGLLGERMVRGERAWEVKTVVPAYLRSSEAEVRRGGGCRVEP